MKTSLGDLGVGEKIILKDLEKKNSPFAVCFLLVSDVAYSLAFQMEAICFPETAVAFELRGFTIRK